MTSTRLGNFFSTKIDRSGDCVPSERVTRPGHQKQRSGGNRD